jgi:hypothetical protein
LPRRLFVVLFFFLAGIQRVAPFFFLAGIRSVFCWNGSFSLQAFFLAGIRSVFCWNVSILLQAFFLRLFMEQAQKIVLESPEITGRHDRPEEVEPGPAGSIVFQPEGLERPRKLRLVPGRHEPPRPHGPAVEGVPGRHAQPVQRLHSKIRNRPAR